MWRPAFRKITFRRRPMRFLMDTITDWHRRRKGSVVGEHHGECGARAYNGGLGAEPPAGSRDRAPWNWKHFGHWMSNGAGKCSPFPKMSLPKTVCFVTVHWCHSWGAQSAWCPQLRHWGLCPRPPPAPPPMQTGALLLESSYIVNIAWEKVSPKYE